MIDGTCATAFGAVREEFERNFAERDEVGASVCVTVDGEPVVDLWGGTADPETGRAWDRDTIGLVWSCTKGATALCAHMLVAQGVLDLDAPVATYWPDFAKNGKDDCDCAHAAGTPGGARGASRPDSRRRLRGLGRGRRRARRAGAPVAAGHAARVPRAHLRSPRRRDRAPRQRSLARIVLPRGGRGTARPRLPHRPPRRARPARRAGDPRRDARTGCGDPELLPGRALRSDVDSRDGALQLGSRLRAGVHGYP